MYETTKDGMNTACVGSERQRTCPTINDCFENDDNATTMTRNVLRRRTKRLGSLLEVLNAKSFAVHRSSQFDSSFLTCTHGTSCPSHSRHAFIVHGAHHDVCSPHLFRPIHNDISFKPTTHQLDSAKGKNQTLHDLHEGDCLMPVRLE